jgi:hypothetical protein
VFLQATCILQATSRTHAIRCAAAACCATAAAGFLSCTYQVIAHVPLDATPALPPKILDAAAGGDSGTHDVIFFGEIAGRMCCLVEVWSSLLKPYAMRAHVVRSSSSSSSSSSIDTATFTRHILQQPTWLPVPLEWHLLPPPLLLPISSDQHEYTLFQVRQLQSDCCTVFKR